MGVWPALRQRKTEKWACFKIKLPADQISFNRLYGIGLLCFRLSRKIMKNKVNLYIGHNLLVRNAFQLNKDGAQCFMAVNNRLPGHAEKLNI